VAADKYAKKLRNWEEKNPVKAIAAGFNPAYGAASGAAAIADPDAPLWEKLLGGAGMVPGLGAPAKATVLLAARLRKYPHLLEKASKFLDPVTGKKMAELSDHESFVDKELIDQMDMNRMDAPLNEAYQHPELMEAEPYLKDVKVARGTSKPEYSGEYKYRRGSIPGEVRYRELPDPKSEVQSADFDNTMRHETQHAVDDAAGILDDTDMAQPWDDRKYFTLPSEIRARLTGMRGNFTPKGREKYPFDKMMKDELQRLEEQKLLGQRLHEADRDYWKMLLANKHDIDIEDLEK
jgi:hypothetical protein